ncbi:MAG: exodeoxyribonuclease VII small subunit [Bacteroidales bacterium]|nr:exodeoxyribonuclease VII small subunit [Bacteroidales bacterium]
MEDKLTYEQALAELEKLVADIENPEHPLTSITDDVRKAMELIKYCKSCINGIDKELKEIIDDE